MEDIYKFTLDNETFERVLSGKKTVQLVVNDSKHKDYAVGNLITFVREPAEGLDENAVMTVNATIENLMYFADIKEAVETLGKESCGFKHSATIEKASDIFLSTESFEATQKNGLVALMFKIS